MKKIRVKKKTASGKEAVKGKVQYGKPPVLKALPDLTQRKPDADPLLKFKLDEERDARIERDKDNEKAAAIYDEWKSKLINRRRSPGQLIEKVNELAAELETHITGDWKWYVINNIINPVIQSLHNSNVQASFGQLALCDCQKCGWGGKALFHKPMWDQGKCEMDCPQCQNRLTQVGDGETPDMITDEQAREIYKKVTKGKK